MTKKPITSPSPIDWFRNAAPYIKSHRGKTFVILYETSLLTDTENNICAHDIALLTSLGIRLVILFDEYPQNKPNKTHDQTFSILSRLSMELADSPMKEAQIKVITGNFITAQPLGIIEGHDHQDTGKIRNIKITAIKEQLDQHNIVLIPPTGFSPTGREYYVPATKLAPKLTSELQADKLIGITPHPVTQDLPNHMTLSTYDNHISKANNTTQHWLDIAQQTCQLNVPRVHLIHHQKGNELLQELFTNQGAGTLITKTPYPHIRQAKTTDIGGIMQLIKPLEEQNILVPRTQQYLEVAINEFTIIELDGHILGCAALHPYPEQKIGELACLAIHTNHQNQSWGETLLKHIKQQAKDQYLNQLIVLTTQTEDWFIQHGFTNAALSDLPLEKQLLYNYQRQSKVLSMKLK